MDRKEAKGIRGKKFSELMTEKLLGDQGVGEAFKKTLSEKSKARMMGIKETFDPLNIAKVLTGNSKLVPAIIAKMTGRSPEDVDYFIGRGKNKAKGKRLADGELNIHKKFELPTDDSATQVLGLIYRMMLRVRDEEIKLSEESHAEQLKERDFEDTRNKELIKALTGRRKPKKKKEVPPKEEPTKAPEKVPPKEAPKPPTPKEAPKPAPKAPEKVPPKEAPKPPEKVAPKEVPKEAPKAPPPKAEVPSPKPPSAAKVPPVAIAGNKGLVIAALAAAGISSAAQSNILANVDKESGFNPRSEELGKYSGKTLYKLYGPPGVEGGQPADGKNKVRFPTLASAEELVSKGPEAVGDVIYGGRMGNNEKGDGYKYRGRGFIQITGKEQYAAISKEIGVDLVKDPDLANDPSTAAKIIPAFFKLKLGKKGKLEDLENIDRVNSMVGSASEKSKADRKVLAAKYKSELGVPSNQALPETLIPSTGTKIDQSSKENKQLKDEVKDKPPIIVNNNTATTTQTTQTSSTQKPKGDDTSAYQKKVQQ